MKLTELYEAPASLNQISRIFESYLCESKQSDLIEILEKIFKNEHPDFDGLTIYIRPRALSKILKSRNERVYKNLIDFLNLFKDSPKPFEYNILQSGQMRAHRIKHSSKGDKEYSNSIKVDILGKSFGLLFHAGPKSLPSINLTNNDIYLVAFGDHGELGT
jgi:wyosine [tRNA(Phe)-imidazoG37] synthetase (radical SAM superfamily)